MNDPKDRGMWTSASNAESDALCPGRHLAQRGLPDEESAAASSGKRIHAALALADGAGLNSEEFDTFEACRRIEATLVSHLFQGALATVQREQRLWVVRNGLRHSGQPDAVFQAGTSALIVDYKTGSGEVAEHARNPQLRDLAVLYGVNTGQLEDVIVAVIQPMVTHDPGLCKYTQEDRDRADRELADRITASNNPDSPRFAGQVQCRYCRAKGSCLAYQHWAGGTLPVPRNILDVPVVEWKPEEYAIFLDRAPIAQKWLDTCHQAAIEFARTNKIPGWQLKLGVERETISNAQEVFDRFSKLGGELTTFMACITVGKGKLRDALKAVTGAKGKSLDSGMEAITQGCVEVKQTSPTLKKE